MDYCACAPRSDALASSSSSSAPAAGAGDMSVDAGARHVYCMSCILPAFSHGLNDPMAVLRTNGVPCSMSTQCILGTECIAAVTHMDADQGASLVARIMHTMHTAATKAVHEKNECIAQLESRYASAVSDAEATAARAISDETLAFIKRCSAAMMCPQCATPFGAYTHCNAVTCGVYDDAGATISSGCRTVFCGICKFFITDDAMSAVDKDTQMHIHVSNEHSWGCAHTSKKRKLLAFILLCTQQTIDAIRAQPVAHHMQLLRLLKPHFDAPDVDLYPLLSGIRFNSAAITEAVILGTSPWKRGEPVPACDGLFREAFDMQRVEAYFNSQEAKEPAQGLLSDNDADEEDADDDDDGEHQFMGEIRRVGADDGEEDYQDGEVEPTFDDEEKRPEETILIREDYTGRHAVLAYAVDMIIDAIFVLAKWVSALRDSPTTSALGWIEFVEAIQEVCKRLSLLQKTDLFIQFMLEPAVRASEKPCSVLSDMCACDVAFFQRDEHIFIQEIHRGDVQILIERSLEVLLVMRRLLETCARMYMIVSEIRYVGETDTTLIHQVNRFIHNVMVQRRVVLTLLAHDNQTPHNLTQWIAMAPQEFPDQDTPMDVTARTLLDSHAYYIMIHDGRRSNAIVAPVIAHVVPAATAAANGPLSSVIESNVPSASSAAADVTADDEEKNDLILHTHADMYTSRLGVPGVQAPPTPAAAAAAAPQ
jgi:hypothetical protein